jgi:peptidoglycan-associated lipoprotein
MVSLLITVVVLAGCAKRPAMTGASAPPPSGGAQATTPGGGTATGAGTGSAVSGGSGTGAAMAPSTGSGAATGGTSGATGGATATSPGGGTTAGPSPARPAVQEFAANPNLKDINFDFDKYDIRPGDAKILDANATWLKGNNNLVLIEGHCDERGTNEYNLALGERRAKATMNYLVSQGVQAARITIISYGEERPLCTEKTEACWARNRRAHFLTKAR